MSENRTVLDALEADLVALRETRALRPNSDGIQEGLRRLAQAFDSNGDRCEDCGAPIPLSQRDKAAILKEIRAGMAELTVKQTTREFEDWMEKARHA